MNYGTLLDISNTALLTIAIGYIGYFISYTGYTIKLDDRFYKVLLFSSVSIFGFYFGKEWLNIGYLTMLNLILTVIISALWRSKGKTKLKELLGVKL